MKIILLGFLVLSFAALSFAQPAEKCFKNLGLKDEYRISFTIDGRQAKGELMVVRAYEV